MNLRSIAASFALSSLVALAGCGGAGLVGGGSSSTSCSPSSYTLQFPTNTGYSITGQINAASGCFSSAQVTTSSSVLPLTGAAFSAPSATTLLYLGITFSTTEYANGLPSLSITMPSTIATAGHQFYLADYSGGLWFPAVAGPVTASGSTVSFPVSNGATTFSANQQQELALYRI